MQLSEFQTLGDPVLESMSDAGAIFIDEVRASRKGRRNWERRGQGRWLTFCGTYGTGKTFISKLISRALDGTFMKWHRIGGEIMNRNTDRFNYAMSRPLLVLDDIGAGHSNDYINYRLFELLNERQDQWTIMTTNLTLSAMAERDGRISSRLVRDGNEVVECSTIDFALRK